MRIQGIEVRIVDLSRTLYPGKEDRRLEIRRGIIPSDDTIMHEVDTMSHLGTHVEAPSHFYEDGKDVVDVPLESFLGRAVILDIHDPVMTTAVLDKADGGRTKPGDMILIRNRLSPEKTFLGVEAARWLAAKKIKLLGFDLSLTTGQDKAITREVHDILMGPGVVLLEQLDNLDKISKSECFLFAAPLKIKGLDSSPVRAFAVELP